MMRNYLKSDFILEERINIGEIPAILFRPRDKQENIPTIIFYHGWSSSKESQRIRGFILASVGFQVILPDAIYHGEREPLKEYSFEEARRLFWKVILNNMEEAPRIIEEAVNKYSADPERIGLTGHSMGGFTAAGIFTHNPHVKTLVVLNGSCNWEDFNGDFKDTVEMDEELEEIGNKVRTLDPMKNIDRLKDRPILLLHGEKDSSVPIRGQKIFYEKIKYSYEYKDRIKFIEYPNLNHYVTTNMMEETIEWFYKYL